MSSEQVPYSEPVNFSTDIAGLDSTLFDFTNPEFDALWTQNEPHAAPAPVNVGCCNANETHEMRRQNECLQQKLAETENEIRDMHAKIDRILQIVENLDMWSGALNPVISMLLENMGNPGALESKNVETWLNATEGSDESGYIRVQ
ncbi:MAG: hypothetical protein Q9162_002346 [Coniocarpon cinnabarinum]